MISQNERKFVETMLAKAVDKKKTEASKKNDVDVKEVEQLTDSIRRRIQRGE